MRGIRASRHAWRHRSVGPKEGGFPQWHVRARPATAVNYCRFAWELGGTRVVAADADADGIPACCAASDSVAQVFYFLSGSFNQSLG